MKTNLKVEFNEFIKNSYIKVNKLKSNKKHLIFAGLIDRYFKNTKARFMANTRTISEQNKYAHIFDEFAHKLQGVKDKSFRDTTATATHRNSNQGNSKRAEVSHLVNNLNLKSDTRFQQVRNLNKLESVSRNTTNINKSQGRAAVQVALKDKNSDSNQSKLKVYESVYNALETKCTDPNNFKCNVMVANIAKSGKDSIYLLLSYLEHATADQISRIDNFSKAQLRLVQTYFTLSPAQVKLHESNSTSTTTTTTSSISDADKLDSNQQQAVDFFTSSKAADLGLNALLANILLTFKDNEIDLSFVKQILDKQSRLSKSLVQSNDILARKAQSRAYGLDQSEMELLSKLDKSLLGKLMGLDPLDIKLFNIHYEVFERNISRDDIDIMTLNVDAAVRSAIRNFKKAGVTKAELQELRDMGLDNTEKIADSIATFKAGQNRVLSNANAHHDTDADKTLVTNTRVTKDTNGTLHDLASDKNDSINSNGNKNIGASNTENPNNSNSLVDSNSTSKDNNQSSIKNTNQSSDELSKNGKYNKLITQLNKSLNETGILNSEYNAGSALGSGESGDVVKDKLTVDPDFARILELLEKKGKVRLVSTLVNYNVIKNDPQIHSYYIKDLNMIEGRALEQIKHDSQDLIHYLDNLYSKGEIKHKYVDEDKLPEFLCIIHLWKESIYGNNPKILTFLNKIKNPDLRELVENIEILKLLKDETHFGLLDDSINRVKSNKVVKIKDLVKDILEIKKYRNTSKYVDLKKEVREDIARVLQDNDLISIMNDIKTDLQVYKTNDVFTLRRMKIAEELIVFQKLGALVHSNDKVKKVFCSLSSKYFSYVDVKLSDYTIQAMLNSDKQEDFDKLLLISQIYNLSVNSIIPLIGTQALFASENLKKAAMFYAKMKFLYNYNFDICSNIRFKQRQKESPGNKKTEELIKDLWDGIDAKCKDLNSIKECQVLINTDSSLNNKMSLFVNDHTSHQSEYVNHSDKDIHDINLKILNEIQSYLTQPNLDSSELKNRVYEISKLLPLHHPAHEAVDNALSLLAKKEAEENKLKDKQTSSREIDFTMLDSRKFNVIKNMNLSDDELSRVPTVAELYKTTNVFKVVTEEGAVYSSDQVKSIIKGLYDNDRFNVSEALALIPLENPYDVYIEYLGSAANLVSKNGQADSGKIM